MSHQVIRNIHKLSLAVSVVLMTACASTPEFEKPEPPVYPPPPAKSRFIYEATLKSSGNIAEPSFADKLREVATGSRNSAIGFGKPYGVAVHKGKVYVSDTQQRAVMMFDLIERKVKMIGAEDKGKLVKPLGIDVSKEEEIFVADITAQQVVVFDLQGNFRRNIGSKKLLTRPVSVTTDPNSNKLYVVDTGGLDSDAHHILVFDRFSGEHLTTIGKRGRGENEFNIPLQASVAPDGSVYIVDSGNFRIQKLSKNGEFIGRFGNIGRRSGQFSRPKGIATDKAGNVYVVDTAFGNVQIFNPEGELLLFLGNRATSGGPGRFSLPAGIDVDENGKIYIVDQFFRKVEIIRPIDAEPFEVFQE